MEESKSDCSDEFTSYSSKQNARAWKLDTSKATQVGGTKRAAYLYFFGIFCPFHKGHTEAMKLAETYVRENFSQTHDIAGAWISPSRPQELYQTLKGWSVPNSLRNHLISVALQDEPLWSLDANMSLTSGTLIDLHQRLSFLTSSPFDIFCLSESNDLPQVSDELYDLGVHFMVFND